MRFETNTMGSFSITKNYVGKILGNKQFRNRSENRETLLELHYAFVYQFWSYLTTP